MSNTRRRRHFTGQEKVAILRRHLVEKGTGERIVKALYPFPDIEYNARWPLKTLWWPAPIVTDTWVSLLMWLAANYHFAIPRPDFLVA